MKNRKDGRKRHWELIDHFVDGNKFGSNHINMRQTWDKFGCHIDCSCGKHFDVPYHEIEPSLADECTCSECKKKTMKIKVWGKTKEEATDCLAKYNVELRINFINKNAEIIGEDKSTGYKLYEFEVEKVVQ